MNWRHLRTFVWLRWRLTVNQWRKTGGLGAVFAAVVLVAGLVLGVMTFAGGLLSGARQGIDLNRFFGLLSGRIG